MMTKGSFPDAAGSGGQARCDDRLPVTAEAIIYVTGLPQMRAFYQECFGLQVADSAGGYCVLTSGAWILSLVASPAAAAVPLTGRSGPA